MAQSFKYVVIGKGVKVKFIGQDNHGVYGTWTRTYRPERAERAIADELRRNPTAQMIEREIVDRYGLQAE